MGSPMRTPEAAGSTTGSPPTDKTDTRTGSPTRETPEAAAGCAAAFVHAVVWGEHTTLWELLSDRGRATALSVAVRQGLDRVSAERIRNGLADPLMQDRFLQQLLAGLRRDFRSVEASEVTVGSCNLSQDGSAVVELLTPSKLPGTRAWPAGQLWCSCDINRGWVIDKLEPRKAGP